MCTSLFGFLTSSPATRLSRWCVPRLTSDNLHAGSGETMTSHSVSASHIMLTLTLTQRIGSGETLTSVSVSHIALTSTQPLERGEIILTVTLTQRLWSEHPEEIEHTTSRPGVSPSTDQPLCQPPTVFTTVKFKQKYWCATPWYLSVVPNDASIVHLSWVFFSSIKVYEYNIFLCFWSF